MSADEKSKKVGNNGSQGKQDVPIIYNYGLTQKRSKRGYRPHYQSLQQWHRGFLLQHAGKETLSPTTSIGLAQ